MKLRTGFLRTQTNTSGVPRVMYRTGLSTVRLRGGGAAGHQVFTLCSSPVKLRHLGSRTL